MGQEGWCVNGKDKLIVLRREGTEVGRWWGARDINVADALDKSKTLGLKREWLSLILGEANNGSCDPGTSTVTPRGSHHLLKEKSVWMAKKVTCLVLMEAGRFGEDIERYHMTLFWGSQGWGRPWRELESPGLIYGSGTTTETGGFLLIVPQGDWRSLFCLGTRRARWCRPVTMLSPPKLLLLQKSSVWRR